MTGLYARQENPEVPAHLPSHDNNRPASRRLSCSASDERCAGVKPPAPGNPLTMLLLAISEIALFSSWFWIIAAWVLLRAIAAQARGGGRRAHVHPPECACWLCGEELEPGNAEAPGAPLMSWRWSSGRSEE